MKIKIKAGKIAILVNIIILAMIFSCVVIGAQETEGANETGTPMLSPSPNGDETGEGDATPGDEGNETPGGDDQSPEITDGTTPDITGSPGVETSPVTSPDMSPDISPNQTTSPIDNVDDDGDQRILWTVIGLALLAAAIIWLTHYLRKKR